MLESNLMAASIVVGLVAALAVLFAFFKPFRRFIAGSDTFADALGAGIWIRAVGTLAAGGAVLSRMSATTWHDVTLAVYLFGWMMVTGGYFLHFSAWAAAYYDRKGVFVWEFLAVLIVSGIGAFGLFTYLGHV